MHAFAGEHPQFRTGPAHPVLSSRVSDPRRPLPFALCCPAGVKADYERLKQTGDYDPKNPNGVGMAWTHNFLNQKVRDRHMRDWGSCPDVERFARATDAAVANEPQGLLYRVPAVILTLDCTLC
mgnify:CR=1 FL=1